MSTMSVHRHTALPAPQEELKSTHSVGEREVSKQRNLDRVRIRDPTNRKRIVSSTLPSVFSCAS